MTKRKINNIGVLDIRSATERSVEEIGRIGNVGTVISSPETSHLISKISIGNMGSSVVLTKDYEMFTGKLEITSEYLGKLSKPLFLYITGKLFINENVRAEDIEKGIGGLIITGKILCPEKLAPAVQSKIVNQTGKFLSYPGDSSFINGTCVLNDAFLHSLKPASKLFVTGNFKATGNIDKALIEEKIGNVEVSGKMIVDEQYLEIINRKTKGASKCVIIPQGYLHIEDDLVIDSVSIKKFSNARLYTETMITFKDDVRPEMLQARIDSIKTTATIVCREELREPLVNICEGFSPAVLYYSGRHITVEDEYELDSSELEFAQGRVTIMVMGELIVGADVAPELMIEKIEFIDNFGEITANSRQIGAIKNKLRTNKGEIINSEKAESSCDDVALSNAGYLKL